MKKVSVSVRGEHIDLLDEREEDSRSRALRAVLDEYEELHTECEELRTRCERLENEKQTLIEQREEHGELVRYVREERSAERRRREAGLVTRAKWWAFGMPTEEER
jgi:chromosome segregation ATPase